MCLGRGEAEVARAACGAVEPRPVAASRPASPVQSAGPEALRTGPERLAACASRPGPGRAAEADSLVTAPRPGRRRLYPHTPSSPRRRDHGKSRAATARVGVRP